MLRESLKHKLKEQVIDLKGEKLILKEMTLDKRLKVQQISSNTKDIRDVNYELLLNQVFYEDNGEPLFNTVEDVKELNPFAFNVLVGSLLDLNALSSKSIEEQKKD